LTNLGEIEGLLEKEGMERLKRAYNLGDLWLLRKAIA
jgi:hypothetical protein